MFLFLIYTKLQKILMSQIEQWFTVVAIGSYLRYLIVLDVTVVCTMANVHVHPEEALSLPLGVRTRMQVMIAGPCADPRKGAAIFWGGDHATSPGLGQKFTRCQ